MDEPIREFSGPHRFLSNFWSCPVMYEGVMYQNAEAAFQAAKCLDPRDRQLFTTMNPSLAKKTGRHVPLRPGWDDMRLQVMRDIVTDKFTRNPELAAKLKNTGHAQLIEGNTWNDRFWGVDLHTGIGENHLGQILMDIRATLN